MLDRTRVGGFQGRLRLFIALALFASGSATLAAVQDVPKTPLKIDDLYRYEGPRSGQLSPDGKSAAYVRYWIDPETREERYSLWIARGEGSEPEPMEEGEPDARAPIFSPDGRWILFLSGRPRPDGWRQTPEAPPYSEPTSDIWLIPTEGGKAIPLGGPEKPYGRVLGDYFFGRLAFSPDGHRLAFVADDGRDPRTPEEREANVIVVRPDGGEGYTGYGNAQIWVADLDESPGEHAARQIQRLTDDDVWYGDPQWSPDGKFLVVHANRTDDRESVRYSINKNYDLWAIDLADGSLRQLTSGPGPEVSPRFSPDGKRLVCLSIPRKGSHHDHFNLAIVALDAGGPTTRILFDHHGPEADKPPHPSPSFPLPQDCWEGEESLLYNAALGMESARIRLDLKTGRGERDTGQGQSADDPDGRLARQRKLGQLLPSGNAFLRERLFAETTVIDWENEGYRIEAALTKPLESVAKPPYALIVLPHGGPHSRASKGGGFNAQIFAAHGFATLQPNFRGSDGYGQDFINADRNDLGGGDMRDILAGVDLLIEQGVVDPDRQFVYGVSYGGFMTSWMVGQTNRFRAAVAQNPVTELNAMWGLSDLQSWTEWEFGGLPWEVPAAMRKHSPFTYAANVQTPTLILQSRDDRRCPLPMAQMFHQALRANGVETMMVIYPDEGHPIRQPRHRADVLRRIVGWFEAHDVKRED